MSLKMIYKDLALGADSDAEVTVTTHEEYSSPDTLPFGVSTGAVATCELNAWGLTSTYKVRDSQPFAFWSNTISNAQGEFATSPEIVLGFDNTYISTGLTLRFSPDANEYCSKISVVWYLQGTEKERVTVYPNMSNYALENAVEGFDSIKIVFEQTSLPYRRVKLEYIGIGIVREFDGSELMAANFVNEIDYISDTVPVNVADISFHSKTDAEFIFQKKQPVEVYDNSNLICVYYVEKGERISSRNYAMNLQDAIGVLDLDTYSGCMYLEDVPFRDVILDIVGGLFEVEIDGYFDNVTLKGYISPELTRREALQHACFAGGACIDTMGSAGLNIFPPRTGAGVEILPEETYQGGKVTTSDLVTGVSLTSYDIKTGTPDEGEDEIKFNGITYRAIPTAYRANNPNCNTNALPNIVEYSGCYLINSTNAEERLQAILDYHMRRNIYSAKHVMSGQKLGERVEVATPWGDTVSANIIKMTLTMSGIVASDSEFLLD